jgi:hypothetical protein
LSYKSPWVPPTGVPPGVPLQRPSKPMSKGARHALGAAGIIIVLVLVFGIREDVFFSPKTTTITVCDKERAATSGGGAEYRVYASEGTLVIKDTHAFTQWRTDSADVYGRLHKRHTYEVTYVGFRWSPRSWFPNIVGFKQVATNKKKLASCEGGSG